MRRLRWSSGAARRRLVFALLAVLLAGACVASMRQPTPESFGRFQLPSTSGAVTAYFLGTSSILFRDDSTAILIDGFVSRPPLRRVIFGRIAPDTARIKRVLATLRIRSIAAVVATHSDYDHAMDGPEFARRTGAVLLGSASTRHIGVGGGLDTSRLPIVRHADTARFGKFHLTFLRSRHGSPNLFPGTVTRPLRPPRKAWAWKTDTVYSVLIRHGSRSILVNATANFDTTALKGRSADVVYLAGSGLSRRRNGWMDRYWRWVVSDRGACRVILVHWDNFFRSLDEPLEPMPWPIDSFGKSMRRILDRADTTGVDVVLPVPMIATDPFAGLPGGSTDRPCATRRSREDSS